MDGSITASASLRMREQLRSAFHAPVGGAGAGLFEELLRMPVVESRSGPDDDAPTADSEILAQPAAPEASQKSASQPEREQSDVDDEESEQASLESADAYPIVQPIIAQASPVEPAREEHGEAVDASDAVEQSQPRVAVRTKDDAPAATTAPTAAAPAAAVEQPSGGLQTDAVDAAAGEAIQPLPAVEEAAQTQADSTTQSNVALETSQAPVTGAVEGDSEQSGRSSRKPTEPKAKVDENPAVTLPSDSQGIPAANRSESQTHVEADSQADPHELADTPTQNPAVALQTDKPSTESNEPADTTERREKWFVKDDDQSQVEGSGADSAEASQDRSALDALTPSAGPAETPTAPTNSELQSALDDAATAGAVPSTPTVDTSALASALAQQSTGTSAGGGAGGNSDSRMASHGVGQGTGGRATGAAAAPSASSGTPDGEQGGVAGLSQHERVRLVQRVARSFSRLGPDGGQVTLKLHPPQLGVLNMSVRIEGQTMTARLQTETTGARDAILENLPVLRERLAEQGIEVESFRVEVASDGSLTADSQSQAQSQNAFSGDSASDSRSGTRDVDYRRLARSSHLPTPTAATRPSESPGWSTQLPVGRTLDVRA